MILAGTVERGERKRTADEVSKADAISPGPLRASRYSMSFCIRPSRKRRPCLVSVMDVGIATAFLAHEASRLITGDTLYVDGGYHVID